MCTLLYIVNNKRVEIGRGRAIKLLAVSSRMVADCLLKELTTNEGDKNKMIS